jgi:dipeptidyl aminopeptidase/acylaminoacyl peptidase
LGDNETIFFQSEETGYSHLYTYNFQKKTQLTKGNWEVRNVSLSKDKSLLFNHNDYPSGNRNFYKLDVANAVLQPILTKDGAHE